jgi:hypothetical protein
MWGLIIVLILLFIICSNSVSKEKKRNYVGKYEPTGTKVASRRVPPRKGMNSKKAGRECNKR